MPKGSYLLCWITLLLVMAACARPTPTPPAPDPTVAPSPIPSLAPAAPREPSPFPTPPEPAPEATFMPIGSLAGLTGKHEIAGLAVVAGSQTLIVQGFTYDGQAAVADIRLVKAKEYGNPAAVLLTLERQPYKDVVLLLHIPSSVQPGAADTIAVYNPNTGEVLAEGLFH